MHAFMLTCVYVNSECKQYFSQLVGLCIEGHSIVLHMNAAGLTAAYPTDGSTIERRPAANVMLVHHCGFRLLFGRLSIWQLEFQELIGFLKAAEGHGSPTKAR